MLRNQEQIKSWFYKIISNTALTLLRKKKKILPLEDDTLADLLGGEADIDNLSFESMIHLLRPEYKSIIVLRFFEEMTLEEIAQTLNINLNTVKSRLYRALHQLRAEMEEQA
ncbi:MAG: RNA polymerase sigma factor, partial [Clostridia bacterium]